VASKLECVPDVSAGVQDCLRTAPVAYAPLIPALASSLDSRSELGLAFGQPLYGDGSVCDPLGLRALVESLR